MNRRAFITLLGVAAAWPLAARAQQQLPVIGILSSRSRATDALLTAGIRQGLNDTGFIEGRNVSNEYRWAEGNYGRLAALAADLVDRKVAVIVTIGGDVAALAAKAGRGADELWIERRRGLSSPRRLCRSHSQGRKTGRPAHSTANEVRAGD